MDQLICVEDYEKYAQKHLPPSVRDYYNSGAGEQHSLKLNTEAFKKYRIRPRFLRDVSKRDLSTTVLGEKISMPLGVAPAAMQRMAHPDGECANARVKRAERAGFKALVLTIDAPMFGDRRADIRNNFTLPSHLRLANFDEEMLNSISTTKVGSSLNEYVRSLFDPSLSWNHVKWLKSITKLPIILKGILTPQDALLAIENGAQAIIVSNHGARQVDGIPATIEVLPEIVKTVNGKIEIYMDGGVRQGTDVFKALALGAKMVFIGRPMLWGLTHAGEEGAKRVLEILRKEIDLTFALTGCKSVKDVKEDMVKHESYYHSHL